MALAITILVVALLLAGFLLLTRAEKRSGKRLLASSREKLDAEVSHAAGVVRQVDAGPFLFHAVQAGVDHAAHEVAHLVLVAVRFMERTLTRVVRELRDRREDGTSDPRRPFTEGVERIRKAFRKGEKVD